MKTLFILLVEISLIAFMHYAKYSRGQKSSAPPARIAQVAHKKQPLIGESKSQLVHQQKMSF